MNCICTKGRWRGGTDQPWAESSPADPHTVDGAVEGNLIMVRISIDDSPIQHMKLSTFLNC